LVIVIVVRGFEERHDLALFIHIKECAEFLKTNTL